MVSAAASSFGTSGAADCCVGNFPNRWRDGWQRPQRSDLHFDLAFALVPRGLDARIRRVLGQVEDVCAVHEERPAAFAEIQPARVDFGERRNQAARRETFLAGEPDRFGEQPVVREVRER